MIVETNYFPYDLAALYRRHATSGSDGAAVSMNDEELTFYNSRSVRRNCCGAICHMDCCFPAMYRLTSERILHTTWEYWYPCDSPLQSCLCWPVYLARHLCRDFCCCFSCCCVGGNGVDSDSESLADNGDVDGRGFICSLFRVPTVGFSMPFLLRPTSLTPCSFSHAGAVITFYGHGLGGQCHLRRGDMGFWKGREGGGEGWG